MQRQLHASVSNRQFWLESAAQILRKFPKVSTNTMSPSCSLRISFSQMSYKTGVLLKKLADIQSVLIELLNIQKCLLALMRQEHTPSY